MVLPLVASLLFLQSPGSVPAYKDAARAPSTYHGPGRDEPDPTNLTQVSLGYFGPASPDHSLGGSFWTGVNAALEEANREGGYRGKPFRLLPAWTENPWAGGISRLAQLTYREGVWAVIGSIDGTSTHLAEQVAAKALFPIIDPGSTDVTVNFANLPWIFSCLPSDRAIAAAIGESLAASGERFVVIRATEHDARVLSKELERWFGRNRLVPAHVFDYENNIPTAPDDVRAAVVLAPPEAAVRVITALRQTRPDLKILGGPSLARSSFLQAAGSAADGVLVPVLAAIPQGRDSWDYAAAQAYDATRMLVTAIRRAGLNRARIRDALEALSPWRGTAGLIEWDAFGRNTRPVRLGVIERGQIR